MFRVNEAGTSTGLYATDTLINNATVWVQQGTNNIGSAVVDMIDSRTTDGLVVVATHGSGVFSTNITSVNQITSVKNILAEQVNFSVYPNPVSDVLNVEWDTQLSTKNLKLSVINELGQIVISFQNVKQSTSKISLPVGDLPKGVYYLKIGNGKLSNAKKFIKS